MITPRQSTPEHPLTVIDHIADLARCQTIDDVAGFTEQLPPAIVCDERFGKAVAKRCREINDRPGNVVPMRRRAA